MKVLEEIRQAHSVSVFINSLVRMMIDLKAVFETAYVMKHVEHKAGSNIPWSIRQMTVYQKFHCATKTSSHILIQTSQNVRKEVFRLVQEGAMADFPNHWKNVHEIHLSSLSSNWLDYIKFLESMISDIVRFIGVCTSR